MDNMEDEKTVLIENITEDEDNNYYTPKTPIWKSKKFLIITGICIVAVIAIITTVVIIAGNSESDIEKHLETANRYLLELDYEQAIAEFEKIIKADPKCVEAYIGLAEAYKGLGEPDKAREVLEKGYEKTKSEKIKRQFDEIEKILEETTTQEKTTEEETTQNEGSETTTEQVTTTAENTAETIEQTSSQKNTTAPQETTTKKTIMQQTTEQKTTEQKTTEQKTTVPKSTEQQTTTVQEHTTEQVTGGVSKDMRDEILFAAKDVYNKYRFESVFFYDFDLDGIPEMCMGDRNGHGRLIGLIFSYNGEKFVEVTDIELSDGLTTYQNAEGKYITIFNYFDYVADEGYGGIYHIDLTLPDKIVCIGRISAVLGGTTTYKYYDAANNEITKEQYDNLLVVMLAGYTEVESLNWENIQSTIGDADGALENAYNIFVQ